MVRVFSRKFAREVIIRREWTVIILSVKSISIWNELVQRAKYIVTDLQGSSEGSDGKFSDAPLTEMTRRLQDRFFEAHNTAGLVPVLGAPSGRPLEAVRACTLLCLRPYEK